MNQAVRDYFMSSTAKAPVRVEPRLAAVNRATEYLNFTFSRKDMSKLHAIKEERRLIS